MLFTGLSPYNGEIPHRRSTYATAEDVVDGKIVVKRKRVDFGVGEVLIVSVAKGETYAARVVSVKPGNSTGTAELTLEPLGTLMHWPGYGGK